jgi:hypothetical protein
MLDRLGGDIAKMLRHTEGHNAGTITNWMTAVPRIDQAFFTWAMPP